MTDPPADEHPLASTAVLLEQARDGDERARSELVERYRAPLARFLRGRLSASARGSVDTADIVQDALAEVLAQLARIEYRGLGAFWCYVRRIGINRILEVERRRRARPPEVHDSSLPLRVADDSESRPLAALVRKESCAAIDAALESVPEPARGALLLRLELGLPYAFIAAECGYPSADAARMAIARNLAALSQALAALEP